MKVDKKMKLHAQSILKISLVFIAITLILPAMGAVADERVCNITDLVVDTPGRTEVIGDKELDYRFFPLSNPDRLVFDFKNARLTYNDGYLAELKPSSDVIHTVRISQFSLDPDIVRLVVEPAGDEPARISRSNEGTRLIVDFGEVITKIDEQEKPVEVKEIVADLVTEPAEEPIESDEPEITEEDAGETKPQVYSQPEPLPFRVFRVEDGIAVDVRGVPKDKVSVSKKFRPRRIIIETGDISGKVAPQPLGKIDVASGPVSNYETFAYEGDCFRLVLNVDKNTDYREEALPDGVRVVISEEKENPIKILSSSDETEVVDGEFLFEIGTPDDAGKGLGGFGKSVESVLLEIGEDAGKVKAPKPIPVELRPKTVPIAPMSIYPPYYEHKSGMDFNLVVGDMAVLNTVGLERVSVGNPEVISVNVISQEEILITGKAEGQSAIMTWEAHGMKQVKWVEVKANVDLQTRTLMELIDEPNITANIIGENVILEGTVNTDVDRERAILIATSFGTTVIPLIEVLEPKQVMVKVRMVEIDKKAIDDYFNQVSAGARTESGDFTFAIVSAIIDPEIPGGGLIGIGVRPGIVNGNVGDIRYDPIDIALDYLETERKANILSEPNLLALHGTEAKFRVGGEIPYTYQNDEGVNVVEFKEFGVELNMTPMINSNNSIRLKLNPIVRTVDYSLAIGGIPGFRTREMTTEVQLKSGQTMVIGGLIQNEVTKVVAKIPLLGDIPILGQLFRSKKFQEDVTELLVFITPIVLEGGEDLQGFVTHGIMGPEEREALFEKTVE